MPFFCFCRRDVSLVPFAAASSSSASASAAENGHKAQKLARVSRSSFHPLSSQPTSWSSVERSLLRFHHATSRLTIMRREAYPMGEDPRIHLSRMHADPMMHRRLHVSLSISVLKHTSSKKNPIVTAENHVAQNGEPDEGQTLLLEASLFPKRSACRSTVPVNRRRAQSGAHHFTCSKAQATLMTYQRGICQIHNVKRQRFIHSLSDQHFKSSERARANDRKNTALSSSGSNDTPLRDSGSFMFEEAPDLSENFPFHLVKAA